LAASRRCAVGLSKRSDDEQEKRNRSNNVRFVRSWLGRPGLPKSRRTVSSCVTLTASNSPMSIMRVSRAGHTNQAIAAIGGSTIHPRYSGLSADDGGSALQCFVRNIKGEKLFVGLGHANVISVCEYHSERPPPCYVVHYRCEAKPRVDIDQRPVNQRSNRSHAMRREGLRRTWRSCRGYRSRQDGKSAASVRHSAMHVPARFDRNQGLPARPGQFCCCRSNRQLEAAGHLRVALTATNSAQATQLKGA
jgi:hypothetical protein